MEPEQNDSDEEILVFVKTAILDEGEQTQQFQTIGVKSPATGDDGYRTVDC